MAESTGVILIKGERQRQIANEGFTAEHDAQHKNGELCKAAIAYARVAFAQVFLGPDYGHNKRREKGAFRYFNWPWDEESWKPTDDAVCNLKKAGALIAAEIDRITRENWPDGEGGVHG